MTMQELLERIRALYVGELARRVAETEGALPEVALRHATGQVTREGELDVGMRIDVAVVRDGEVVDRFHVASGRKVQFEPITATYEAASLELHPFFWDGFTVAIQGDNAASGTVAPLADWFAQWFGAADDDPAARDEDGLRGVAHFISDPEPIEGGRAFEVDLGSAPVEAFVSLLDACVALGARRVTVRS